MPRKRRPRLSWFRFFADDFLGGTGALSAPETGRYLLLLLHQWGTKERQLVPAEADRLRLICRGEDPGPLVMAKFVMVEGGLRNLRLAEEWDETRMEFEGKVKGGGARVRPDTVADTATVTVADTGTVRVRKPQPQPHTDNGQNGRPANPLLAGRRPQMESEGYKLIREINALEPDRDPTEILMEAARWEMRDGRARTKVRIETLSDDHLIRTVHDLKSILEAVKRENHGKTTPQP